MATWYLAGSRKRNPPPPVPPLQFVVGGPCAPHLVWMFRGCAKLSVNKVISWAIAIHVHRRLSNE